MTRRIGLGLAVVLVFSLLTAVMTLPQVRHLRTLVPNSDDPLLSIWRISWIAHILPQSPADLLNGNIFYPEKRTLAYTDSVLLEGFAAAPLIWAGVPAVAAYNLLVLGCITLSGAAMFLYASRLTGSAHAAWLAGIVFAFVPFRFDHFPHLELQATMFLPLALWWCERMLATGDRRDLYGFAAAIVAQVYSGIYYAVFLVTALAFVLPFRIMSVSSERRRALVKPAVIATLVAVVIVAPYLSAYVLNRDLLGDRSLTDVRRYSATWSNYLAALEGNLVHGRWSAAFGRSERRLFPGALAIGLALIGLARFDRQRLTLVITGLTGLVISLGINTPIYDVLREVVFVYRGLRAPARASILVFLAISGLTAYGWARLQPLLKRWATVATVAVAGAMLLEYATVMTPWLTLPQRPPSVYTWLATQPRSVVVEFPIPRADRLDFTYEGFYMVGSTVHWQPLLNGYSGFFPRSFLDLTEYAKSFPDERSIGYLKHRGVDLIVVHGGLMSADEFGAITSALLARSDVEAAARFEELRGPDLVFRLRR
ncbi:MAG: hypothetical protein ABI665_26895 [Vicinamibacterales bacterium]